MVLAINNFFKKYFIIIKNNFSLDIMYPVKNLANDYLENLYSEGCK